MPNFRLLQWVWFLAAVCLLVSFPAEAAPQIRWEVANRFPLFRQEAQFRAIADIYAQLPAEARSSNPVLALETQLEDRANARQLGKAFGDTASIWRYGWASALARSTCFSSTNRGHWSCRLANGEDFISQRTTDILVSLDEAPANATCQWLVNGVQLASARCTDTLVRLPRISLGQEFLLAVRIDGSPLLELAGQTIRPVVILGMGDSFASGEGNPDQPVPFGSDFDSFNRSSRLPGQTGVFAKVRQYPLRLGHAPGRFGAPALWLSQQCHRSLYSHQLKAALQIALEAPHASVTFLGYACTGAEVVDGLLGYWKARDDVSAGTRDDSPQIMRALRDLCSSTTGYNRFRDPGRFSWDSDIAPCKNFRVPKIDALLLSIGGNDIGFSSVIANETVDSGSRFAGFRSLLYGLWLKSAGAITFQTAIDRQLILPPKYDALARAFDKLLNLKPAQVIQTGYPQMLQLDHGTCPTGTAGMDVHEIFSIAKSTTGPDSVSFVRNFNARIRSIVPWQVVDGFAAGFAGHALCASGMADGSSEPGGLTFPLRNIAGHRWSPIAPSGWQPYRIRQRWFVTPNDAFLAANYMRTRSGSGGDINTLGITQPLLAATLSGAFHPNALGQAAIGDGVVKTLRFKLQLPQP